MKLVGFVSLAVFGCAITAPAALAQPVPPPPTPEATPSPPTPEATPVPPPSPSPAESAPASTPPGAPRGVQQMRLSEVLATAIRQEPSLQRATIDVRIAEAAVLEAAGIDDWVLGLTGGWVRENETLVFQDPFAGLFVVDQDVNSLTLDATVERSLGTGGVLTLGAGSRRTDENSSFEGLFATETVYQHSATARLLQPLWRGFGKKYARSDQARARIARRAADLDREQTALESLNQVIAAYWELAYAWRDLEIRRASLALAREQLRTTEARIATGAVTPDEALAVEQIIASRSEAIVLARVNITQRSLALRELAGLEIGPGEVALWADAPLDI
ncbi:MAG TPA: TolC family protein, partial [Haliangium sp.]|nr:TolC family protein [Haliangium sp.]